MWDNELNQMYRFAKRFDRRNHVRELARIGHTGIEINRYATTGGYFVNHRKYIHDSYAWYLSYAPSLDAYVESSLIKGYVPSGGVAIQPAKPSRSGGARPGIWIKAGFRLLRTALHGGSFFDKRPELRGSRTDHPGRGYDTGYQLDIANPEVLEHYAEMMTLLMHEIPDLRYFTFLVDDSGQGIPFTMRLYPGPNSSFLARSKTVEGMVADFTQTILDAGRKINPEFEVIMVMNRQYTQDECKRIMHRLPKHVTVYHPVGRTLLHNAPTPHMEFYFEQDRADHRLSFRENPYRRALTTNRAASGC
jgi:hypothetical protein